MVIHIKRSDTEQFLFETTCATSNDELIRHLVRRLAFRPKHVRLFRTPAPKRHRFKCGMPAFALQLWLLRVRS